MHKLVIINIVVVLLFAGFALYSQQPTNTLQWAGQALGAASNYGTSPGAVLVPGVNAFVTNTPSVAQSGTWNIGTITSIINPVTTTGNLTNNNAAPISSLIGMLPCLANSAAPAWTNGNLVLLSCDLSGNIRTIITNTPNVNIQANASVNIAQVGGSAVVTAVTGVQKVGIVGNAGGLFDAVQVAQAPANALLTCGLGSGFTGGSCIAPAVGDTYKVINISTATTTLLITGVAGRQVHITAIHFIAAGADNIALIEGTGATCGTGTAGMAGGTTAATGYNLVANQGYTFGSGMGTVIQTVTAGDSVCVVTSAAVQLSGGIEYAIY